MASPGVGQPAPLLRSGLSEQVGRRWGSNAIPTSPQARARNERQLLLVPRRGNGRDTLRRSPSFPSRDAASLELTPLELALSGAAPDGPVNGHRMIPTRFAVGPVVSTRDRVGAERVECADEGVDFGRGEHGLGPLWADVDER
jgi:hypothetical protein